MGHEMGITTMHGNKHHVFDTWSCKHGQGASTICLQEKMKGRQKTPSVFEVADQADSLRHGSEQLLKNMHAVQLQIGKLQLVLLHYTPQFAVCLPADHS